MQYLLCVYLPSAWWQAQPAHVRKAFDAACQANRTALQRSGHLRAWQESNDPATFVRVRAGQTHVSDTADDSPAAAPQAYRAAHYVIDARDLNEAIRVATKLPQAHHGVIEVLSLCEAGEMG